MNDVPVIDIPYFTGDVYKLLFKFGINMAVLIVIIRFIYYPQTKRKDFLFTFFLISLITFFICFVLEKNKVALGLALGLFAVFGIIRYRTDTVPIKEMTYLFVVIGVSLINALANSKTSLTELILTNSIIVIVIFLLERIFLVKHESNKLVLYEKIELIKPDKRPELLADLESRTGLKINRVSIQKINFLRDTAQIIIYYYENEKSGSAYGTGGSADSTDDDD